MATTYKRVLLKLSGEALKSGSELFDFPMVQHVAQVIRQMHELGTEIGIVIGAGNIWRGRQGPSAHMDAVTADQMGMLGTMINCLCVADALRKEGVDAVVMSAVDMDRFAQPFNAMIAREYLARRGGVNMKLDRLVPARCPLLGYALKEMKVDGQQISPQFLRPETQETLGIKGYDKGAAILTEFFSRQLEQYDVEELHPVGKQILECFKKGGSIQDYCKILPLGLE